MNRSCGFASMSSRVMRSLLVSTIWAPAIRCRNVGVGRDIVQHDVGEYALERTHVKIAIADGGEIKEHGFDCHGPHYTAVWCCC